MLSSQQTCETHIFEVPGVNFFAFGSGAEPSMAFTSSPHHFRNPYYAECSFFLNCVDGVVTPPFFNYNRESIVTLQAMCVNHKSGWTELQTLRLTLTYVYLIWVLSCLPGVQL